MTIPFSGSAGDLFNRAGVLFGGMGDALALVGGPATTNVASGASFPARVIDTISPEYADGTPIPQCIYDAQTMLATLQNGVTSAVSTLAAEAQRTLYAMVNIDTQEVPSTAPLAQLVQSQSPQSAIQVLVSQMTIAGYYVQPATVSAGAQTAVGTPNGNAVIVTSLKNPQGVNQQLVYPETLTFVCIRDAQTGGAVLGNETLSVTGQVAVGNALSPLWPGGSAASNSLTAVTAGTSGSLNNNSAGNAAVNGAFLNYSTSNYPDNFSLLVGSAGTAVLNGAGTTYLTGAGSVEFVGDSSTLTSIAQSFGTNTSTSAGAGGTPFKLAPDTVYNGIVWYKLSSASPAAGVFQVDLVNSSNAIVADDAGTNNTAAVTLSGVANTSWHPLSFTFRTPKILPAGTPTAKLRLHLTTALTTGTNVYLSNITFTPAKQLYQGGPWCSLHAGSSQLIAGVTPDTWTVAISNNYQTSGDGLMQSYFQRVFNLLSLGLQLPVSGSTEVLDSLIG